MIAEKFVECTPGSVSSPELDEIQDGDGKGQRLLPVERTSSPVDADLVNNIMRRPFRERFSILIGEFGAGLAGPRRGPQRGDPPSQSGAARRPTGCSTSSPDRTACWPTSRATPTRRWRRSRARRSGSASWIEQANATGEATAERRADIEASIQKLPGFLRELRPTMADLGAFADQAAPVARDLNIAGRDISRGHRGAGPVLEGLHPGGRRASARRRRSGRPIFIKARPVLEGPARPGGQPATRSRTTWTGSPRASTRRAASNGSWTSSTTGCSPSTATTASGTTSGPPSSRTPARASWRAARPTAAANFLGASTVQRGREGLQGRLGAPARGRPRRQAQGRQRSAPGRHRRQSARKGSDARGQAERRAHQAGRTRGSHRLSRATTSRCSTTSSGAIG